MSERSALDAVLWFGRRLTPRLAVAGLAVGWVAAAQAQPADPPQCATLLSAAELQAIAPGAEEMRAVEHEPGHSECSWMLNDEAGGTLSMSFWDSKAVTEALIPADTLEEFFEMNVRSTAEVGGTPGEVLEGVGVRSVLFRQEGALTVYVLTRVGVAYLITGSMADAKLEAVARAVATP